MAQACEKSLPGLWAGGCFLKKTRKSWMCSYMLVSRVYMRVYIYIYVYIWSHPMIHMRLLCYIVNTIFCMQLCLVRNRKHYNLQYFLPFRLYSNCISYVLVLSLRSQNLKPDSGFKILCFPDAYTYTYTFTFAYTFTIHTNMNIHIYTYIYI